MTTWYDNNPSWAKEAVEKALALSAKHSSETTEIVKTAGDIGIGTGTLIGGLIGAGVANKAIDAQKDQKYRILYGNAVQNALNEQNKKLVDMSSDYYTQIDNLDKDLKIIFTPFSVVYMLRGTAVDSISTDTMNKPMQSAWQNKDAVYFKNILVNRVYLDSQEAEQMFIKRLIEQDKFLRDAINKKSSECDMVEYFPEDKHVFEILASADYFKNLFMAAEKSPTVYKYANALTGIASEWEDISVPLEIGMYRYGSDGMDLGLNKLSFLFFGKKERNTKDEVNFDVLTPNNIIRNLSVVYLPDRLLYVSEGMVVTQLNVMELDELGYSKFVDKDDTYFKELFLNEAKTAGYECEEALDKEGSFDFFIQTPDPESYHTYQEDSGEEFGHLKTNHIPINKHSSEELSDGYMTKEAFSGAAPELFTKAGIHPKIYYLFLMQEFGKEWIEWDTETLESMIKDNFGVPDIADAPLNKLLSVMLLMHSDSPYTGFHTFEKVIRSFNDKPIDFEQRESNITFGELVNGIRIMGEVIQDHDDNIYDNFSEHVLGYIVEILHSNGYRRCVHKCTSQFETLFWRMVNIDLLELWVKTLPYGITGVPQNEASLEAKTISRVIQEVYDEYERKDLNTDNVEQSIINKLIETGFLDDAVVSIIKSNVVKCLAVNYMLKDIDTRKEEQIKYYLN